MLERGPNGTAYAGATAAAAGMPSCGLAGGRGTAYAAKDEDGGVRMALEAGDDAKKCATAACIGASRCDVRCDVKCEVNADAGTLSQGDISEGMG